MVKWTAHAIAQLRHIHDYIAQDSPLYAKRVSDALVRKTILLDELPRLGRKCRSSTTRRSGSCRCTLTASSTRSRQPISTSWRSFIKGGIYRRGRFRESHSHSAHSSNPGIRFTPSGLPCSTPFHSIVCWGKTLCFP
ncbi:MAG: type II toxin-antitoxin system RelE/ParE family toxin [Gammaproteobacteria bacterium]|nr:type II toxin-antitoxin system RelE/ParE family toxin [Gammaproteobacteria bacterium]